MVLPDGAGPGSRPSSGPANLCCPACPPPGRPDEEARRGTDPRVGPALAAHRSDPRRGGGPVDRFRRGSSRPASLREVERRLRCHVRAHRRRPSRRPARRGADLRDPGRPRLAAASARGRPCPDRRRGRPSSRGTDSRAAPPVAGRHRGRFGDVRPSGPRPSCRGDARERARRGVRPPGVGPDGRLAPRSGHRGPGRGGRGRFRVPVRAGGHHRRVLGDLPRGGAPGNRADGQGSRAEADARARWRRRDGRSPWGVRAARRARRSGRSPTAWWSQPS